jgi:hypothetical protein
MNFYYIIWILWKEYANIDTERVTMIDAAKL